MICFHPDSTMPFSTAASCPGHRGALKILQSIVGVPADGRRTHACRGAQVSGWRHYRHSGLLRRYMRFLRSLTNPSTGIPVNGRGCTIRITGKDPKKPWANRRALSAAGAIFAGSGPVHRALAGIMVASAGVGPWREPG